MSNFDRYFKQIIIVLIVCVFIIFGFAFKTEIKKLYKTSSVAISSFISGKKIDKPQAHADNNETNRIEITTAVSLPYTEKLKTSGITSREMIKIVADSFREIEFVVPKDVSEVKKGTVLVKYKTKDLELRAFRLQKDVELKTKILERGEKLDEHSVISKDDLDKLKIEVANATGELKEIQHKIEESTKIAPFDCFIKHHGMINGSFVSNGQEILTILRKDKLFVDVNISMREINELEEKNLLGKNVKLYFSNKKSCKGKVVYFLNNADPYTATLSATVEVQDEEGVVTSGELCDIKIYTGVLKRLFLVPEEAICGEEYDYHVFVIRKNLAYKTPITRHEKKGEKFFISGVSNGDVIATSGAHRLTNLCSVIVQ